MAVTTTNLIMGAGELLIGAFGSTEPTSATGSIDAGYRNLGGTMDGVTLNVAQEYTELEVDQVVDVPGRRLTKREMTIETNLAEPTLDNLAVVLNQAAPTTTAGSSVLEAADVQGGEPLYKSLLFKGIAPAGKARLAIIRRALSTEGTEAAYQKDEQTVWSVTFSAHYVSSSVKPFKIIDEVAV